MTSSTEYNALADKLSARVGGFLAAPEILKSIAALREAAKLAEEHARLEAAPGTHEAWAEATIRYPETRPDIEDFAVKHSAVAACKRAAFVAGAGWEWFVRDLDLEQEVELFEREGMGYWKARALGAERLKRDAESRLAQTETVIAKVREAAKSVVYLKRVRRGYTEEDYSRPLLEAKPLLDMLTAYDAESHALTPSTLPGNSGNGDVSGRKAHEEGAEG